MHQVKPAAYVDACFPAGLLAF